MSDTKVEGGNVASAPVPMTADGSALLQHTEENSTERSGSMAMPASLLSTSPTTDPVAQRAALRDFFDVEATARFILQAGARKVALQFPDEWLGQSARVLRELQADVAEMEKKATTATSEEATPISSSSAVAVVAAAPAIPLSLCILADTSYGSCCVDEVAAQHANCDLIVHYGFSCLSATRRMPVRYVFGRKEIDGDKVAKALFDDAAWRVEEDSYSFGSSSTAPAAAAVVEPPMLMLVLYSLEFAHAVSNGSLPRAIQTTLAARYAAAAADPSQSKQFVVSLAQVDTEQATKPAIASASPAVKCGTGGPCKSTSTAATEGAAATAATTGCCTPSSSTAATGCCKSSPSSSASSSCATSNVGANASLVTTGAIAVQSTSRAPLIFSSGTPSGILDPASTPMSSFELNGFHFSFPTASLISTSSAATTATAVVDTTSDAFHRINVIWIGSDTADRLLVNCMLNFNAHPFHSLDPSSSATTAYRLRRDIKGQNRTLARRFYLMEKSKSANIVGILVGTLGVANYMGIIKYIQGLLKSSGKKSYIFVVGKLNEPKLSNFAEVDLFVLVACPLNTMFDSTGYYRDVVTPFELNMALKGIQWKGEYATSFDKILPSPPSSSNEADNAANAASTFAAAPIVSQSEWLNDDLESGVRFDPITGKMREALPSHLAAKGIKLESQDVGSAGALLATGGGGQLTRIEGGQLVEIPTASQHFATHRTFHGLLLQHEGEVGDEIAPIEQGLTGIARSYTTSTLKPADKQLPTPQAAAASKQND